VKEITQRSGVLFAFDSNFGCLKVDVIGMNGWMCAGIMEYGYSILSCKHSIVQYQYSVIL